MSNQFILKFALLIAGVKPTPREKETKVLSSKQESSQSNPKKTTHVQGDNSNLGASGTVSDQPSKSLGNPGWPSKTENPIITPSNSSSINKGESAIL